MANRVVILSRLNIRAAPLYSLFLLQLSRQGGVDVPVDQVDREHREDRERYGDHYEAGAFDLNGFGQDTAVEPDEHPRVEEHHDPAARGSDDQQPERLDARPDDYGTTDADDPR